MSEKKDRYVIGRFVAPPASPTIVLPWPADGALERPIGGVWSPTLESVESGVAHAKKTPLKGQRFESLEEAQVYLDQ